MEDNYGHVYFGPLDTFGLFLLHSLSSEKKKSENLQVNL